MTGGNDTDPSRRLARKEGRGEERAARVTLFGFAPTVATAMVLRRTRRWRLWGAIRRAGAAVLVAPLVALVPPHVPWLFGALGVGSVLARRRWSERLTLLEVRGPCPSCSSPLAARSGRLREPHPITCDTCRHEVWVDVDPATPAPP